MGTFGNGDKERSRGRGSVKNSSRLAGFKGDAPASAKVDWGRASPQIIAGVVALACWQGIQVTFLTSRDGGAYGLTLYDNGERVQLWFNGDCDIDAELNSVGLRLEEIAKAGK